VDLNKVTTSQDDGKNKQRQGRNTEILAFDFAQARMTDKKYRSKFPSHPNDQICSPEAPTSGMTGKRQKQIPFGNDKQKGQRQRFWLRQNDEQKV
jgi:hypothetical protein